MMYNILIQKYLRANRLVDWLIYWFIHSFIELDPKHDDVQDFDHNVSAGWLIYGLIDWSNDWYFDEFVILDTYCSRVQGLKGVGRNEQSIISNLCELNCLDRDDSSNLVMSLLPHLFLYFFFHFFFFRSFFFLSPFLNAFLGYYPTSFRKGKILFCRAWIS